MGPRMIFAGDRDRPRKHYRTSVMRKSLAVAVVVGLLAISGVGFGLGLAKKAGH
jgi:hypothetical protein